MRDATVSARGVDFGRGLDAFGGSLVLGPIFYVRSTCTSRSVCSSYILINNFPYIYSLYRASSAAAELR